MSHLPRRSITMIRLRLFAGLLVLGGIVLGALPADPEVGQGVPKKASSPAGRSAALQSARPSLDALKSRVSAFWNLLQAGRKAEAAQYVEPSRRKNFEAWHTPVFSQPRITTLTLSPKAEEVSVTVEVKATFPPVSTPVSWPVTADWVFQNGTWFALIEKASAMVLFPTTPGNPNARTPNPEEMRKRQVAIREAVHFETTDLEFGTVRRGDIVPLSLGYSLAGDRAFEIVMRDFPPGLIVRNPPDRTLPPGKDQKIQMQLLSRNYAGEVNEKLIAVLSHENAEVPFEFKIHGFVYTPVYSNPMTLRFLSSEREKSVVIRNLSKSEVTLNAAPSDNFRVGPLPQTLPPGGTCTLQVSLVHDTTEKNAIDSIWLGFAKPVENMDSLELTIVRNYEEITPEKAREMELKELLRKAGVPVKK